MEERIQKLISASGLMSRRTAEDMIRQGRVRVNGRVCGLGEKADPSRDVITFDGKPVMESGSHVYIMLNKPVGYVTTLSDEKGRKSVSDLLRDVPQRVYPVGRLDMYSGGLLLLTNDGEFANRVMHPSSAVDKEYLVRVKNPCTEEAVERLRQPFDLDGYVTAPAAVSVLDSSGHSTVLSVIIHEGRNRQVRRMCAISGLTVLSLTRVSEGNLKLGDLPAGKWRYLTEEELFSL